MSDLPDLFIESRTAAGVDDSCGMAYWWNFQQDGRGIVPVVPAEPLSVGIDVHNDLELIAGLPDKDLTVGGLTDVVKQVQASVDLGEDPRIEPKELLARRLGWLAAFGLFMEPRIREEFKTIQVESEIILDRDPLFVPITPDRVLEHRKDHHLVYREWKSTITAGPKWIASWPFAVQIHAGIRAIEEDLDRKVAYGQVMGLLKGTRTDRLSHPFVWAYRNVNTGEWTADYAKARAAGWEHAPVWEFPGGPVQWVAKLGKEACLAQFPHSYPVFLNERLLNDWLARRLARQEQIAFVKDDCVNDWTTRVIYFEPRTSRCRPPFGDECPYLKCCWNAGINENPLLSGQYEKRTPHHEAERVGIV